MTLLRKIGVQVLRAVHLKDVIQSILGLNTWISTSGLTKSCKVQLLIQSGINWNNWWIDRLFKRKRGSKVQPFGADKQHIIDWFDSFLMKIFSFQIWITFSGN